jgi:quinol monooxygenase YgiN
VKEKLFVVANVVAQPGKEDLHKALLALIPITQKEPGFVLYDLHESLEQLEHFVFYEIWEDEHYLSLHSSTDSVRAL